MIFFFDLLAEKYHITAIFPQLIKIVYHKTETTFQYVILLLGGYMKSIIAYLARKLLTGYKDNGIDAVFNIQQSIIWCRMDPQYID